MVNARTTTCKIKLQINYGIYTKRVPVLPTVISIL
nr:MAG TPA: hypothetical protein [Caudoviricetes sp.]DAI58426.1 MAG TPA: hypothetical protein [Crassvirales sp.]